MQQGGRWQVGGDLINQSRPIQASEVNTVQPNWICESISGQYQDSVYFWRTNKSQSAFQHLFLGACRTSHTLLFACSLQVSINYFMTFLVLPSLLCAVQLGKSGLLQSLRHVVALRTLSLEYLVSFSLKSSMSFPWEPFVLNNWPASVSASTLFPWEPSVLKTWPPSVSLSTLLP